MCGGGAKYRTESEFTERNKVDESSKEECVVEVREPPQRFSIWFQVDIFTFSSF